MKRVLLDEIILEVHVPAGFSKQQCRAIKQALKHDLIVPAVVSAIAMQAAGAKPDDIEVLGWVPLNSKGRRAPRPRS